MMFIAVILLFICTCPYVTTLQYQKFIATTNASSIQNYEIRVKQPISCEKSIQYSGYIDNLVTNEHVFFVFLESRFAPRTDPVILSLNGQLGCSSITHSWLETGLCLVKDASDIETNPFSFSNIANILYIDQPTDVGYSYTKDKKTRTSDQVSDSIYWFLQSFFTEFKQFANNQFHIAGTSYASHFVPSLATRIIRENRYATSNGKIPIQLASIIIGNGYIHPQSHQLSYADYACDNNNNNQRDRPIFDTFTCQKIKINRERCNFLLNRCRSTSCSAAALFCKKTLFDPFFSTSINPYDIRKRCIHNDRFDSCYKEIEDIETYANRQDVKTEFGVDTEAGVFSNCNKHVKSRFELNKDSLVDTIKDIEKILTTKVRVLVYSGDMNWYNNWYGQRDWLSKLDWESQVEFNNKKEENWFSYVSGRKAGTVKNYLNLAFVRVFNAGYYTVYDQPENMIDLYSRWVMNIPLGN